VIIERGCRRPVLVVRGTVTGQGHQQHVPAVRLLTNSLGNLVAVHPGKADVDNPNVRTHDLQQFQTADAVGRVIDHVPGELEHHPQHLACVLAVLYQKHPPGPRPPFW
jgi:hypothetical protein